MPSVTVLMCPLCGAPLDEQHVRCAYCGSLVVIETDHPRLDPAALNRAVVDEHIAKYRATVRRDPNDETAHYGLGLAYFSLGLVDEAADELGQAARLQPENPHIQTQLAVIWTELAERGHPDARTAAWDRVNRALLLQPGLPDAMMLKAKLEERDGKHLTSISTLRQLTKAHPDIGTPKLSEVLLADADSALRRRAWTEAVVNWRETATSNSAAVRRPISDFLNANQEIFFQTNRRPLDLAPLPSQAGHAEPDKNRWIRTLGWAALAVFLSLCIAMVAVAIAPTRDGKTETNSVAGVIAVIGVIGIFLAPVGVVLVRWQYSTEKRLKKADERSQQAASKDQRIAAQKHLLDGTIENVSQLLSAAENVATELSRRDHRAALAKQPPKLGELNRRTASTSRTLAISITDPALKEAYDDARKRLGGLHRGHQDLIDLLRACEIRPNQIDDTFWEAADQSG